MPARLSETVSIGPALHAVAGRVRASGRRGDLGEVVRAAPRPLDGRGFPALGDRRAARTRGAPRA